MFKPYAILAIVLCIISAAGSGYLKGRLDAKNAAAAARSKEMTLEQKIQTTIAEEVAKIKVTNTYVRGKIETITREVPVYRECVHDPRVLGMLNDVLTGKATVPSGGSVVPAADPVD